MNAASFLAAIWPFNLEGPSFLRVFWTIAAVTLVGGFVIRRFLATDPGDRGDGAEPTPYEVACLAGPPARAVHAAIAQLAQDGLVSIEGVNGTVSFVRPGEVASRPPIEQSVLRAVAGQSGVSFAKIEAACAPELADLQSSLQAKGLLLPADGARLAWLIPLLMVAAVQLLAILRIIMGLVNHKRVLLLVLSCFGFGILASILLGKRPFRSKRGEVVLANLKTQYKAMQRDAAAAASGAGGLAPGLASLALPLAVGVLGYSVLAGTPADGMYQRMRSTGGDGSSYGSDSSSDSGGGDGGGDGGGGGCGGCGGGGGD